MNYQKTLATFVGLVGYLFSAFNGFLKAIAPPDQTNSSYAVGLSSFLVLNALLLVSARTKNLQPTEYREKYITYGTRCLSIGVVAAFIYFWSFSSFTYFYPPDKPYERRVMGFYETKQTADFKKSNSGTEYSSAQLDKELTHDLAWTPHSVLAANMVLLINYTVLVITIAAATFFLLVANITETKEKDTKDDHTSGKAGGGKHGVEPPKPEDHDSGQDKQAPSPEEGEPGPA